MDEIPFEFFGLHHEASQRSGEAARGGGWKGMGSRRHAGVRACNRYKKDHSQRCERGLSFRNEGVALKCCEGKEVWLVLTFYLKRA